MEPMKTTRLSRPSRVRIESNHELGGTRVLVDGQDLSAHVLAVSWSATSGGKPPTAMITFMDVEIEAEADGEHLTTNNVTVQYG